MAGPTQIPQDTLEERLRAALEAQQRSETRLQLAMDAALLGTWEHDLRTGENYWSRNEEMLFGVGPGEFPKSLEEFLNLVHPNDHKALVEAFQSAIAGNGPYHSEYRIIRPDGSVRWLSGRGQLLRDASGTPTHLIGATVDVTERKQAEEDVRGVSARARCILWHGAVEGRGGWDDATHVETPEDSRFAWSIAVQDQAAAQRLLPLDLSDGRSYVDAWRDSRNLHDHWMMARNSGTALRRGDRNYTHEFRCIDRNGVEHWLDEVVSVQPLAAGKWLVFGVVIDVTERKHAERERGDLLAREQRARAEAETANRRKDQFLSILSHELRTPLTPVLAAVGLLKRNPALNEQVQALVDMIRRNVELEATLIDDLLDVTRLSSGKLMLSLEDVDAHATVQHALEIYKGDLQSRNLKVICDLTARHHTLRADPARLQQIFWNVISNAVKFTAAGGTLEIRSSDAIHEVPAARQDNAASAASSTQWRPFLRVEVRDTGVGIEPEVMSRLFKAFEQGEQSLSRRFGGLGLGLSICKALVEMHGGTISAASEGCGRGATFAIELPTSLSPAGAVTQSKPEDTRMPRVGSQMVAGQTTGGGNGSGCRQPAGGTGPAPVQTIHPHKILLVEDNEDTLRLLARLLRSGGHEVRTASGVRAALDAVTDDVDLVISDIGLPDGSGWELMRQLRKTRANRPIPGIALSGFGTDEDIQKSRDEGFLCHLTKPVNLQKLEETIQMVGN